MTAAAADGMTTVPELDLDFVRAQFPAFQQASLSDWAFFENAGGSYPCRQVVDRLTEFYTRLKVQPYAPYPTSAEGGAWMDESRTRLATCLNVTPDAMMFGPSTSQNTYVLAQALRETFAAEAANEIIVTNQDHEANSGVWRRLADAGWTVREWQVDPETGHLDPADLDTLLTERTRAVCFPHCSNIVGEINPVPEICVKIRGAGAISIVDGVSYAPHGFPDVAALGTDVYMFSAYKTYGPHLGIMAVRPEVAMRLANQGHHFNAGKPEKRLVPAGPDHAQIAAAAGMVDYAEALATHHGVGLRAAGQLMRAQEVRLTRRLLDHVANRNDVRLLGPSEASVRAPTVALEHRRPGHDLATELVEHGIMAGGGAFYADRLVDALGVNPEHGVLRLSFVHYTSEAEIDKLIGALDKVL